MDPEANLREQADIAQEIIELRDEAGDAGHTMAELCEISELADRLAELVIAYSTWIKAGGFPATGKQA